jgi:methylenetetrahydrofolate dehydrogenase (NADP+)/methenyltetrahydrofolate cyclohydrolase
VCAQILDGVKIRDQIKQELLEQIHDLKAVGITPGLAAVLVGDNAASQIYVRSKVKMCETLGLYSEKTELPAATTTEEVVRLIAKLNQREEIDGILIQLPLPPGVDSKRVTSCEYRQSSQWPTGLGSLHARRGH